jgi:hypothetical protein
VRGGYKRAREVGYGRRAHSERARKIAGRNDFDEGNKSGVYRLAGRENGAPGWACVQSKRPRAAWKRHAGSHHAETDRTVK